MASRLLVNAIFEPSGDHVGARPLVVRFVSPVCIGIHYVDTLIGREAILPTSPVTGATRKFSVWFALKLLRVGFWGVKLNRGLVARKV